VFMLSLLFSRLQQKRTRETRRSRPACGLERIRLCHNPTPSSIPLHLMSKSIASLDRRKFSGRRSLWSLCSIGGTGMAAAALDLAFQVGGVW
jgi:hypothetical protein